MLFIYTPFAIIDEARGIYTFIYKCVCKETRGIDSRSIGNRTVGFLSEEKKYDYSQNCRELKGSKLEGV